MLKRNELIQQLNQRKSEWTSFANALGISRKTIERTAKGETDPQLSLVEKLSKILTQ